MFHIQVHIKLQAGWKFSSQKAFFFFLSCNYAVWDLPVLCSQAIPSAKIAAVEYIQDLLLHLSNGLSSLQVSQYLFFFYGTSCRFSNSLLHDFVHLWFNPHHFL